MRLQHFKAMVERMATEIPREYLDGIAAIEVSEKAVPHPLRDHVYTLGECIPFHTGTDDVMSRVVLHHGSFQALAHDRPDFDWREEAWETLLHELRHHLEWRARTDELEAYDWAAEQSFARAEGEPFDPLFFRAGEQVGDGVYRVDDDVFLERVVRAPPATADFGWHGRQYRVAVPPEPLPLYLTVEGLRHPPPGDVVLVFRRKPRLVDLFRGARRPTERRAEVEALG